MLTLFFAWISSIFEEANEAIYNDNLTDAEIDDLTARLNAIRKAYLESIIRVQPGKYYAFLAQRTKDMVYEDGSNNLKATAELSSLPEILTMDEANYIFKIEDAGEGYYYVQNFGTGNYWSASPGKSKQWKTQASAANKFYFPTYNANKFNICHANGAYMHIDGGYKMVQWDSPSNTGNQYIIQAVDDAQVANLVATIEKQQLVKKYQAYFNSVQHVPGMYVYASGLYINGDPNGSIVVWVSTGFNSNYAIPAGSGYFKYINETTEDGDLSIAIEEMPDGIGSISLNPATKCAEGIYTISGVRVNGKNLPKGVYIINGEKVVK